MFVLRFASLDSLRNLISSLANPNGNQWFFMTLPGDLLFKRAPGFEPGLRD